MQYISTTDLRTKTPALIETLKRGMSVRLIHRSKLVGEIKPVKLTAAPVFDAKRFEMFRRSLGNLPYYSEEERETRYRKYLEKKHGKYLP